MLMKWRTPIRPLGPYQASVWKSLLHREQYMARAYETIALARRQMEDARQALRRQTSPHSHER